MKTFKYNEYEILIDEKETEKYINSLNHEETQADRNFKKYVTEKMTDEEKEFFMFLHINPENLNVDYGILLRNKTWECGLTAFVIGEFVSYPEMPYVRIEDVMEEGFDVLENINNNDITIDHFIIHIDTNWEPGDGEPKNSICLNIIAQNLPWLLNEKCDEKEESKLSEFIHRHFLRRLHFIPRIIFSIKERKKAVKALHVELEKLKNNYGVSYEILSEKELLNYKKLWVSKMLPDDVDDEVKRKALDLCVDSKKFNTYLWHIFSFNIIESIDNPSQKFESVDKHNCTLVFEAYTNFAVKLFESEKLNEQIIIELCNNVAGWCDFVITAEDFSWTYSRTHEDGWCGPYFYQK
ncbi:MAG: DUF4275 family protein [Eubacterium sp.]|nr:DUF4275 family protein [Eubacterium sp.]